VCTAADERWRSGTPFAATGLLGRRSVTRSVFAAVVAAAVGCAVVFDKPGCRKLPMYRRRGDREQRKIKNIIHNTHTYIYMYNCISI